ncbi:MAG: pyridoxamine 5'-phosphate oxidase family protein [Pseudomonadota bacterium]
MSNPDTDVATATLESIPALAWTLLQTGVDVASSPLHTPSIATVGALGPMQRTVVLRFVDPAERLLICHTDRRAAKAREIIDKPAMSWHFYDRKLKLQLRLHGRGVLHTDDPLADACWERSAARSRVCYNTAVGPGTPVKRPPLAPGAIASEAEAADARSNFAAIACRVVFMDWLYLSREGHRRAILDLSRESATASWVTP